MKGLRKIDKGVTELLGFEKINVKEASSSSCIN
jgi:hypothetical protein